MTLTLPVKVTYHKAVNYTEGRVEPVRAIVNHRMVGYVAGTRAYFQNPAVRKVSTHFGIGLISGKLVIDQYVPLDDTAYGNGNYDTSGSWDNWGYKTTGINAQTISIEHQDHGDPAGKGVVGESIQKASIALQALLLRGTIAEWKTAGIVVRDWANNAPILQRELKSIPPTQRRIITHWDIAGKLKPFCWQPWESDKIGFPREKYVAGIQTLLNPPAPVPVSYTQAQLDEAVTSAVGPLRTKIDVLTSNNALLQQGSEARRAMNEEISKSLDLHAAKLRT